MKRVHCVSAVLAPAGCLRAPVTMPQGLVELATGADVELGEHLAQVPLHRAGVTIRDIADAT